MKIKPVVQVFLLLITSWISAQEKYYTQPVKIPVILSGNFGELRSNHFHTGIDIKTLGRTGADVVAAADGYISRISVSPGGYGNVLYVDHPNNTTTVYGHLSNFREDLKAYIRNLQYRNKSFSIDTKVPEGKIRVKKGELIAKSGNSGSSGGPHLHFEVRDSHSQDPENPFFLGFNIRDKQAPQIYSLLVCPMNDSSYVGNSFKKTHFPVALVNGKYQVNGNKPISCGGEIGLEFSGNDNFDETPNGFGIYSAELKTDGESVFSFAMNRLSFSKFRYINSHIDYDYFFKTNRRYIRTWIEPGNSLGIYKSINRGIISVEKGKKVNAEIIVKDASGNVAALEIQLEGKPRLTASSAEAEFTVLFRYNRQNSYENEDMKLSCPRGAFYDDVKFDYSSENQQFPFFSRIHHLHSPVVPVQIPLNLRIKASGYPENLQSKLLIAGIDKKTGRTYYAGGKSDNGWVETTIREFGIYAIGIDTVAPYIIPLSIKNNAITESNRLRFRITDNFSGISEVVGKIDGEWALFESDIKSDIYVHYFDPERFEMKKRHEFKLVVTDKQGNQSTYVSSFWK